MFILFGSRKFCLTKGNKRFLKLFRCIQAYPIWIASKGYEFMRAPVSGSNIPIYSYTLQSGRHNVSQTHIPSVHLSGMWDRHCVRWLVCETFVLYVSRYGRKNGQYVSLTCITATSRWNTIFLFRIIAGRNVRHQCIYLEL